MSWRAPYFVETGAAPHEIVLPPPMRLGQSMTVRACDADGRVDAWASTELRAAPFRVGMPLVVRDHTGAVVLRLRLPWTAHFTVGRRFVLFAWPPGFKFFWRAAITPLPPERRP
jgi:hypothetical protein